MADETKQVFKLAVIDEVGVYHGVTKQVDDFLLWVRSPGLVPVVDGIDLPPHRYRWVDNPANGRGAFVPLMHEKDKAEENLATSVRVNPSFVARALLKLNGGEKLSEEDAKGLRDYLASLDAQGETTQ